MADDPLVSNSQTSSNPDIPVRATESAAIGHIGKLIQHFRLCFGTGGAESVVTAANPLPVTAAISGTPNVNVTTWGGAATESLTDDFSTLHPSIVVQGWDGTGGSNAPVNFGMDQWGQLRVVQVDSNNRQFALTNTTPAGTEYAQIVRPIPSGTQAVSIASLPALPSNQSVNVAQINGVTPLMGDGATGTGSHRVTVAGVAHDAGDSGNPVKVGARARTSNITAVSNDDRVDAIADRIARQLVLPYTLDENVFHAVSAADITNTTSTAVKTATASTRYWITAITVSNMSATVSTRVDILDGSTVIWTGPAALGGGGYSITFPTPRPLTTNTAINAQCATTGAAVRVAIAGYTGV